MTIRRSRVSVLLRTMVCLIALGASATAAATEPARDEETTTAALRRGDFPAAQKAAQARLTNCRIRNDAAGQVRALIDLAEAKDGVGDADGAQADLRQATRIAESLKDDRLAARALTALGREQVKLGDFGTAQEPGTAEMSFARADELAKQQDPADAAVLAWTSFSRGDIASAQQRYDDALRNYREAVKNARSTEDGLLLARALVHAAGAAAHLRDSDAARSLNAQALEQLAKLQDSYDKAFLLITAAQCDRQLAEVSPADRRAELMRRACDTLRQADELAQRLPNPRIDSYALGYLGALYESDGQTDAAIQLTRRAVFRAQEAQASESLYRWQWQLGRLLRSADQFDAARQAYGHAVETLQTIRQDVALSYAARGGGLSFRKNLGPLYYEYADLQLRQAADEKDPAERTKLLLAACNTVELLKTAEIEDYFQDRCVNIQRSKEARIIDLKQISPHTAVIYLIPLPDRLEMVASTPGGMRRVSVPVKSEQLYAAAAQFREALLDRSSYDFMDSGQALYLWLIAPLKQVIRLPEPSRATTRPQSSDPLLVDTLVFILDGTLRNVPMSALSDGEHYLIESCAVAVTPGLKLMEPGKPIARRSVRMLSSGLSEAKGNFPALPYVPEELKRIQAVYGGRPLLNQDFRVNSITSEIENQAYSIVHIASHGQFSSDRKKTFVLTYDDDKKLDLDRLEQLIQPSQFRGQPVELLTLSACETAAGDDRAALGLAGVAVKAGARSALATLWSINDEASSDLIGDFYRALRDRPELSKAKALQAAQLQLLDNLRYRHPCYWAPYLIIGNWL
jgi:CHAT domain-containing protein